MKKKFKNIKGLILAETLISVAMLIIASTVMTTVLTNAVNATEASKNHLIAENLIIESIEVVETIRNSNWLIRPIQKECWLVPNPQTLIDSPDNCENSLVSSEDDDFYDISFNNHWSLIEFEENDEIEFQRKIHFDEVTNQQAKFEVKIIWNSGKNEVSRKFVLYNYL